MNKLNNVIFPNIYPSLDLHGFDRNSATVAINDFIDDNNKMKNEIVVIIHGIGTGILKKQTQIVLKKNPLVLDFRIDNFNEGMTLVLINISK